MWAIKSSFKMEIIFLKNSHTDSLPRGPSLLGYFNIYDQDLSWCFCKEQDQKRILEGVTVYKA